MKKLSKAMVFSGYAVIPGLYIGIWALLIWLILAMCQFKDQHGPPVNLRSNAEGANIEFLGDARELQR